MLLQACFFLCLAALTGAQDLCGRTPMNLRADFLMSCNSLVRSLGRQGVNCDQAWTAFSGAFAGVSPETVMSSNYSEYFDLLPIMVMSNESLFWSKTGPLVSLLSMMNAMGVRVVSSMSDTVLSSEILNKITPENGNLNWCGNETGIDFQSQCLCNVTKEFWERFSIEFAQAARGSVFYLTDGEIMNGAFRSDSFFATTELPNLMDASVTELIVIVIHRSGKGESCSGTQTSIQTLRNRVQNRQFSMDCYDILGDLGQTDVIAKCVQTVVDSVQQGNSDFTRQIVCDGAYNTRMTTLAVVIGVILTCLFCYL